MVTDLISSTRTLADCELVIERGLNTFVEVGAALLEIRDRRLYKDSHSTFEDYCRERWGMSRMRASQLIAAVSVIENVNHGLQIPTSERQARPLAQLEPEQQREAWQRVVDSGDKITAQRVQEAADEFRKPEALVTKFTGDQESYTPDIYIEAAREVMGSIDCDPASNDMAQKTVNAKVYYTVDTDGLQQAWIGNIFLNPPYAHPEIERFIDKLISELSDGQQAILLTNDNTDTGWFHKAAKASSAICLLKGRINFYKPDGSKSSPTNGQTFFYFGNNTGRFAKYFSEFGLIMTKYD